MRLRANTCPSRDKSDRTGSFLGGEGSQTQWEVPGFPTPIWWPSSPPHPTGPNQLVLFEERPSLNPALPIPRGKMVRAEFLLEMWEQSQEDFLEEGEVTFQRVPSLMAFASAKASSSPASWPWVHYVLPATSDAHV